MPKPIPFPTPWLQRTAQSVLHLAATRERLSRPAAPWTDRPKPPEALGNLLQHLAVQRPAAVLVIENLVAEVLAQLESH